ncbi:MAG: class I adenylate-forming enzyme family protein [Sandaracinaceae bacterium]
MLSRHEPDAEVAWDETRSITAAELCGHVEGIAELLPDAPAGAEILVICRDRYRFAVAMLACWSRGYAVALPPNPQLETIRSLRAGVETVIHDVDGVDKGIDVRDAQVVAAARGKVGRVPFSVFPQLPAQQRLATVYTSGSTGAHTACPKTAGQLLGEARALVELFAIAPNTRVAPMVPPHHIYGLLFGVLMPLISGGSFFRRTPLHAGEVARVLESGAGVLVSVPAHLRGLRVAEPGELPPIGRVFSSAAPLSTRVAQMVESRFQWAVTEVLGSSETGGIAWRQSGGRGPWAALPGVEVSADEEGLLRLHSPFLSPDEPRPYQGADRIEMLPDGRFLHRGRADGVLKIGGVRVSLAEVERRLTELPGVQDAAVLGKEVGGARGYEVWAAVVAPERTVPELKKDLRAWLGPMAIPRRLRNVARLPRNEAGKLPRAALLALLEAPKDPA